MSYRKLAETVFLAGIRSVLPGKLISDLITLRGTLLKIGYHTYDLDKTGKVFIIGAGKASAAMAHYVESILGSRIAGGLIITKYGHYCKLNHVKVIEAAHPVPDSSGFKATEEIVEMVKTAGENDLVICLWSGGGSSLLADIPENCSPDEIAGLSYLLVRSGADIREMNTIRKHLSGVKGGNLMKHIWPATCCSVMISDVTGDPPDVIASGPTVPDDTTYHDALRILEYRNLIDRVGQGVLNYLRGGAEGRYPETPKSGDPIFSKSATYIAGNNKIALRAAADEARSLNIESFIITSELFGDPVGACNYIIETAVKFKADPAIKKPVSLLFGGETTIEVRGNGKGGRNQHLALAAAIRLKDKPGITILAGGTDGNDGNTEMAGAVADSETLISASAANLDPETYLGNFDSYSFFKSAGGHIFTGPTMTNVMDMVVVIIV
jgi:hydroxypyruvate reductase/glycerate 2-kinase